MATSRLWARLEVYAEALDAVAAALQTGGPALFDDEGRRLTADPREVVTWVANELRAVVDAELPASAAIQ